MNVEEASKKLGEEVRDPLPARPGGIEPHDGGYIRSGTSNLFVAFEPLAMWQEVAVTDRHTGADFAHLVRDLVDGRCRDAERVVLVMNNPNTLSVGSPCAAFAPAAARRVADKVPLASEVATWMADRNSVRVDSD